MKTAFVRLLAGLLALALLPSCQNIWRIYRQIEPATRSETSFAIVPPTIAELSKTAQGTDDPLELVPFGEGLKGWAAIGFRSHDRKWVTHSQATLNEGEIFYVTILLNNLLISNPSLEVVSNGSADNTPERRKQRRNRLAETILLASDYNAEVWLNRVFLNKTSAETFKGLLSDLMVGAGAATAESEHALSSILSVSSFVVGKTVDNFDKNFFAGQSYLAMETAIISKRKQLSAAIRANLHSRSCDDYSIAEVLADIRELDQTCSLKAGMAELQSRAAGTANTTPVAPRIITQPIPVVAKDGEAVTFTVAATGTAPLRYKWHYNGQPIATEANASASEVTLSLKSVTSANAGTYAAIVTNDQGQAISQSAKLTVVGVTPSATVPVIAIEPSSITVAAGDTATFKVVAHGASPLIYQWFNGEKPIDGKNNEILLIPNLTLGQSGQKYRVLVANTLGSAQSQEALLTVTQPPQKIDLTIDPTTPITTGTKVIFTVSFTGSSDELKFRWFHNGSEIAKGSEPHYSLEKTSVDDAGVYSVLVENKYGKELSNIVTLVVGK